MHSRAVAQQVSDALTNAEHRPRIEVRSDGYYRRFLANFDLKTGDLLTAEVEALVNTVNCVGVMGRGVALQFKNSFPANYRAYAGASASRKWVMADSVRAGWSRCGAWPQVCSKRVCAVGILRVMASS